ncbi:MAG: sigma-70 family RNA polymerase sigma factor [Clostridia bacterium]|nr:sigma-70 family RNA polymerase sigma factor [Clostridia bacterium]
MTKDEFAAAVAAGEKKLYLSALSVTRNAEDAKDAVAHAVYTAWEKRDSLKDPGCFDAWLLRITLNEAKRLRRSSRFYEDVDELRDEFSEEADTSGMEFFDMLSRMKIDDETRRIFALRFFYGYTLEETGRIMKKPDGTVKAKYYRALKKLREEYGKGGNI